ncbi:LuxR C-terminal-related transcriptional regulator [Paenibacillus qinlingensis]|uniref:LuxR C-terminal-related transcriptional regulator n=1 Tax=Paenibacillus qinlingensis TaxID=1837343 RepID=UPI0015659AEA|nr:LuxR C-terminal-related transcriptional regulator [Paenibacillus qinlingensis]NQX63138.1 helix-turn-helix domain-containing protein [Paenibacillus qinlingensis]
MRQTIGERLNNLMFDQFVGRSFETGLFQQFVNTLSDRTERILNVFGTAGIGKTYLLTCLALIAEEMNAIPIQVNLQEINGDSAAFDRAVLHGMETVMNHNNETASSQSLQELNRLPEDKKVVLLIDGYEEAGALDYWMRTCYFPHLPTNVLIVVAGRYPLEGPWRFSAWKKLIVRLPLSSLTYEEIRQYLLHWGITSEEAINAVWLRTLGHPLAVSLLAPAPNELAGSLDFSSLAEKEPIEAMLDHWLLEASNDELRRLLFASSAVRTFHQELLEELLGNPISTAAFDQLIKLSFVSRSTGGWRLHEIVWENMRRTFRERMPEQFEQYNRIAVAFVEKKIEDGITRGKNISKELAELLHYTGNPILRAHYRHSHSSPNYREPLNAQNSQELEAYIAGRKKRPSAWNVLCSDPESQALYRFSFTPEESLLRLSAVNWSDALNISDCNWSVQLLRNVAGRIIGVFTVVAVNSQTWDYLASAAVSRALFQSMPQDQRQQLSVAAAQGRAWYLLSVDVEDLENEQIRSDIIIHLFEYVLAGNLIVASPPPLDYYEQAMLGLGFKKIQGAEHNDYRMPRPASTYWLDTRNDKLRAYVKRMIGMKGDDSRQLSLPDKVHPNNPKVHLNELTKRERDVAQLLLAGSTNREIAASLYISEAAVKKHVNAMLAKFGLKNRTQLASILLGGETKKQGGLIE